MEYLMDALASVLKDPLEDPFLFEWIVIQSRGMRQWISIELAKNLGICANIKYCFPREIIERFSNDNQSDVSFVFWKIMGLLLELINDKKYAGSFKSIKNYLEDDHAGVKLYQLTTRIADLFDDYRIYRPDILAKWQNKIPEGMDKYDFLKWQPVLFNKLIKNGFEYSLFSLDKGLDRSCLPQRIAAFGISSYPPVFLNFFEKLSFLTDVNLFFLVPSKEFFAYSSNDFMNGIDSSFDHFIDQGNPLVSSLGKSGRDLQILMENFNYYEPLPDLWHDPLDDSVTMLSCIQSDILNLVERKPGKDREPLDISVKDDNSIAIHSCHTPMREVQVLKDQLLNLFETNSELNPDEIIVMMPDIESYAPLIEAVFSIEHRLPFTISDRRKTTESKTIKAFLKILNIMGSRFELHSVLDLLSLEPIAEKFLIDQEDLDMIELYTEKAGICWGIDSKHRQQSGFPDFDENTWEFGLKRLFLGYAMSEHNDNIFCDVLPADSPDGLDAEILGKLSLFTDALFAGAEHALSRKTALVFCNIFRQILNSLVAKTSFNEAEFLFILDNIQKIEEESNHASFDDKISYEVAVKILEDKLSGSVSTGSFMTGGITFCNLMPMRSIPFKVIVLMGMNENDFPRRPELKSFSLIEKMPRPGDKNIRDEDRFIFLEALVSARENFIITYTGFDIKNNSPIPCSAIVSEFIDLVMNSFIMDSEEEFISYHPLQPFSLQYYNTDHGLFSFSTHGFKILQNLLKKSDQKGLFVNENLIFPGTSIDPVESKQAISPDDLCYYFKHPIEYIIKQRLGIVLQEPDTYSDDREPLVLNQLDNYMIGSDILEKALATMHVDFDYDKFRAKGVLAFGEKGRIDFEEVYMQALSLGEEAVQLYEDELLPPWNFDIDFNGIRLSGSIDKIRKNHGQIIIRFGRLKPVTLLNAWIHHLVLNAGPNRSNNKFFKTIVIGRADGPLYNTVTKVLFPEIDQKKAYQFLSDFMDCYLSGLNKPFIFFPEISWEFAKNFLGSDQDMSRKNIFKIMQKCKSKWYNSFSNTGEKTNRYTKLFFGDQDLFQNFDFFSDSGFIDNSIKIFQPLMENLQ